MDLATKPGTATPAAGDTPKQPALPTINRQPQEIDGFQLVIDALKLNGIDTIYALPGIPITDLTRRCAGRGHARALVPPRAERGLCRVDRRLPDAEARHLPDGVGAGLPQRPQRRSRTPPSTASR